MYNPPKIHSLVLKTGGQSNSRTVSVSTIKDKNMLNKEDKTYFFVVVRTALPLHTVRTRWQ